MFRCIAALALIALGPALTSSSTVVTGRVGDPVDGTGIGGASVRLGSTITESRTSGRFRASADEEPGEVVPVRFAAQGYRPYRTWAADGTRTRRDVVLFPKASITVGNEQISGRLLRKHFNVVYRSKWTGRVLTRWMEQPEIVLVSHVVDAREDGWYASESRVPDVVVERMRDGIRRGLPKLTGGFLRPRGIPLREVAPGDFLGRTYDEIAPDGHLIFYVHPGNWTDSGGLAIVDDHEIRAGMIFVDQFGLQEFVYSPVTLVHEMGHAVGMDHPDGQNRHHITPLCSIMSRYAGNCGALDDPEYPIVSMIDVITARLTHSRAPGNDRRDHDPEPAAGSRSSGDRRVLLFDGLADASENEARDRNP